VLGHGVPDRAESTVIRRLVHQVFHDDASLGRAPDFQTDALQTSRYDKRGYVFLGTGTTAALVIWLRT